MNRVKDYVFNAHAVIPLKSPKCAPKTNILYSNISKLFNWPFYLIFYLISEQPLITELYRRKCAPQCRNESYIVHEFPPPPPVANNVSLHMVLHNKRFSRPPYRYTCFKTQLLFLSLLFDDLRVRTIYCSPYCYLIIYTTDTALLSGLFKNVQSTYYIS